MDYSRLTEIYTKNGIDALIEELENEPGDANQKIAFFLEESRDILEEFPDELPAQVLGRNNTDKEIAAFAESFAQSMGKQWLKPKGLFPLPENACIATLYEHDEFVGSIVFLNDEEFISSSEDERMILWNVNEEEPEKILTEHDAPVNGLCLDRENHLLASASDDLTIKLWDINSWKVSKTFKGHTDYVSKVAFTGTGRFVSVSSDQTVGVWDIQKKKRIHTLEGHNAWVYALAVSPDGKRALTVSINSTMIVWDLETGEQEKMIVDGGGDVLSIMGFSLGGTNYSDVGHENHPNSAIWTNNGRIITFSDDIIIWDDTDYSEIKRLEGHAWAGKGLALFNNNRYLVSAAKSIKIWDLDTGEELVSVIGHAGEDIHSAAISPDEKYLVTGDENGIIKIWDLQILVNEKRVTGHLSWANSIQVSPNGELVATGGYDKQAIAWNSETLLPEHLFKGFPELDVTVFGFISHENTENVAVSSCQGVVRLLNTASGETIKEIKSMNNLYGPDYGVLFNNGRELWTGDISYRPRFWNFETGEEEIIDVPYGCSGDQELTSDGQFLLTGTYPNNLLEDNNDFDDDDDDDDEDDDYDEVEDSDDDFEDEEDDDWEDEEIDEDEEEEPSESPVVLWDLEAKKVVREFWHPLAKTEDDDDDDDDDEKIYPLYNRLSRDGKKVIALFMDGTLCTWDRSSGDLLKSVFVGSDHLAGFFIPEDNTMLFIKDEEPAIEFWNIDSLEKEKEVAIDLPKVGMCSISPDENYLAVRSGDNSVWVIEIQTGACCGSVTLPTEIREIKYSSNGIFAGGEDGFLYGFDLV
ncbi:MAG: WD40 repeat domain-containing protein [bacterium]|nr:WD40 repeat domain-containing protein [bacterium]